MTYIKKEKQLKAQLVLRLNDADYEENKENNAWLELTLSAGGVRDYMIMHKPVQNSNESYLCTLEDVINESTILLNAIPGLKLIVDESVFEFIDGEEENIKRSVNQLVKEL